MALALVDGKQEGAVIQKVFQRGEGERSPEVCLITESTAADIRDVQTASDKMLSLCPGNVFVQLHVVFRRPPISLAAAAGEGVLHNKSGYARPDATRSTVFVPGSQGDLI